MAKRNRQRQRGRARRSNRSTRQLMSTSPMGIESKINTNQPYRTRIAQFVQVSSDSSGIIQSFQQADPSVSGQNFAEYKSLSDLYSEVRLVEFGCQITPAFTFDEKSSGATLAVASTTNATNYLATSPTYSSTLSIVNGRLYDISRDTSKIGTIMKVVPRPLPIYADVSSPSQSTAAGTLNAGVALYGENYPVSTVCLNLMVFGVYEFRARE